MSERDLDWPGCVNVRDLGGLRTVSGGTTRRGAVVRADGLSTLTAAGWDALVAHGVRTVVDLRNPEEREPDRAPRPDGVTTVELPLEEALDDDFAAEWLGAGWDATPLYVPAYLDRYPDRLAPVVRAVAEAPPGGVAVHCALGRDRTGLVAFVLLGLAGVAREDVVTDYLVSDERLARHADPERRELGRFVEALLSSRGTNRRAAMEQVWDTVDVVERLRAGGVRPEDTDAVRTRLT
jgi:protein tyrosine/serine phosphatase